MDENISCQELVNKLKTFVANSDGAGKPILISEIGAGGIYGYRNNTNDKWTEDYQDALVS